MEGQTLSLAAHLRDEQKKNPKITNGLISLLGEMASASKAISRDVNRAGLVGILGLANKVNVQGEEVKKLDEYSNEIVRAQMSKSGQVCIMASEEVDNSMPVDEGCEGPYTIAFDPLDGSSNIDVNVSIGTIFSIHHKISPGTKGTDDDLLQPGNKQVCAGYVLYGSSTMLVYTAGSGVHGFTLDQGVGEFYLSHPNMQIKPKGDIYSINEGNYLYWDKNTQKYIDYLKAEDKATKRPYKARYVGSLVADFHRTLIYGGLFLYPMDYKDPQKPKGKLRLLYEAAPMAYVVQQAGGYASTGFEAILDIKPTGLHQRVPLIIGSVEDVKQAEKFIQRKA
ncbi:MAG: class 1 fructose-bisphosphatase [Candidatus Schekmanbacteria bacterium]|nr:class 1 fructose-bisphosphatase [Candidatus Schekmanbacteria bacterium]